MAYREIAVSLAFSSGLLAPPPVALPEAIRTRPAPSRVWLKSVTDCRDDRRITGFAGHFCSSDHRIDPITECGVLPPSCSKAIQSIRFRNFRSSRE